jgi:hypothetical protein
MTDAAAGTCAAVGVLHRPDAIAARSHRPPVGRRPIRNAIVARSQPGSRTTIMWTSLRKGRSIPALLILCSPLLTLCNEASATLAGNIDPEPAHGDGQTMAQADQEIDVSESPQPSREPTRELDPPKSTTAAYLPIVARLPASLSRKSGPDFRPRSRALIVSAT